VQHGFVLFKGEDMPEGLGEDVGPVYVVSEPGKEEERGWMSRSQAKQLTGMVAARNADRPVPRSRTVEEDRLVGV
jgi:hypothetical protein